MTMSASLTLHRSPAWARMILLVIMALMPSFTTPVYSADSITTKVDAIATEADTKLTNDGNSAPVTNEITKNAKWLMWLLWLIVPLLVYGSLIPIVIMKAKANEMDAVKNGVIALILGSVMYFGFLAMFFG